jgi:hypothetical protein
VPDTLIPAVIPFLLRFVVLWFIYWAARWWGSFSLRTGRFRATVFVLLVGLLSLLAWVDSRLFSMEDDRPIEERAREGNQDALATLLILGVVGGVGLGRGFAISGQAPLTPPRPEA